MKDLPIIINSRTKASFVGIPIMICAMSLYLLTNHFPVWQPQHLPLFWIDAVTPFMPNSVWIYMSAYILPGVPMLLVRETSNANRFLYAFIALVGTSSLVFWLWPTTYPREQFPLPEDLNLVTFYTFKYFRELDNAANCLPSLHVSACFLASFFFLEEQKEKFPFFLLWAIAIAVTTLTTKQHYVLDVVAGFLMAVLMHWIFYRNVNLKNPPPRW